MIVRGGAATVERSLVLLVSLHSVAVGVLLIVAPVWSCTTFGGWTGLGPAFFPRQAGVFHFVLAFAYLWEHLRYRGVAILVLAKGLALLFLVASSMLDEVPWVVPFSAVTDGLMGAAVLATHRLRLRQSRAR